MGKLRRNEWNFASNAARLITEILQEEEFADSRLGHAEAELTEFHGVKRLDLVIFERETDTPLISGELKLPWTAEGRTPYNATERDNAHGKASRVGTLNFITWNVRRVVVWQTDKPGVPIDQRVHYDDEVVAAQIRNVADLELPQVKSQLESGVRRLVAYLHQLYRGQPAPKFLPLDKIFIANIEAALDSPIRCTEDSLRDALKKPTFRRTAEKWMREYQGWEVSKATEDANIERAARFSCYVLLNRLCFYNVLRRRFTEMARLAVSNSANTGEKLRKRLNAAFEEAKRNTGNYDTVFDPGFGDGLPFLSDEAAPYWRELVRLLDQYDFSTIGLDVIGAMYEQLISNEERHRYGQHYTQSFVVDLINAFAIRRGDCKVLDPSCGGGTFLVRAYARKSVLDQEQDHSQILEGIYGCDILDYACHLSTINLAVRDLIDDDNFPRIHKGDYLKYQPGSIFNRVPVRMQAGGLPVGQQEIRVNEHEFNAIVGNPPYIQARTIPKSDRNRYLDDAKAIFADYPWRAASDIYLHFWLKSEQLLARDGILALLTQSAWLDVDYGIPLQKWMLENFRIVAVLETAVEPWFTDARVATTVTILARETGQEQRENNLVRFVQFRKRLLEVLGTASSEEARQQAVNTLREAIESTTSDTMTDGYRLRVIQQSALEADGTDKDGKFKGSKWGRYLRATDTLYRLQRECADGFVRVRDLAAVQRGTTTNCDAFFLVTDISAECLDKYKNAKNFSDRFGVQRSKVQNDEVTIVRRDDGVELPIEREFLIAYPWVCKSVLAA